MLKLEDNLKFINVDINYIKVLHNVCPEVCYKENEYDNKPFMGMLVNKENRIYVIPLSSAKEKHKTCKNIDKERYLIYEYAMKEDMKRNDIWVELGDEVVDKGENNVKHILSALDIKKMIPIKEGLYKHVELNYLSDDNSEEIKYKGLLNKEYTFCIKIVDEVIEKANKLYDKQIETGKIKNYCCDFRKLEKACDSY